MNSDDVINLAEDEMALYRRVSKGTVKLLINALRGQLDECESLQEQLSEAKAQCKQVVGEIRLSVRQYRHNNDNTGTADKPEQGFVVAYDYDEVNRSLLRLKGVTDNE